jgi:hypothetical protein
LARCRDSSQGDRTSPIKDSKDKKVTTDKPNILDSDVANAIDGAVSASLNNKFAATSQDLEKMLATHMNQMESKFSKKFGNNIHASTSNTGKQIGRAGDDISTLQIPKFPPPPEPSIENIHNRTVIRNLTGVGSFVPPYYASAYSTPPPQTTGIPYVLCLIMILVVCRDMHMYHRTNHHIFPMALHNQTKLLFDLGPN